MTPENDKTLRAIFRGVKRGLDEWNDRRDYRLKYEKDFDIGQKITIHDIMFTVGELPHRPERNILTDRESFPSIEEDEDYILHLDRFFPESKLVRKFHYMMSFGMARDIDGKYTSCDCCGISLNALNCGGNHGMCDYCEIENNEIVQKQKEFDIR